MQAKVLIVYVSGGGNTKEVAEKVSETLAVALVQHDIFRVGSGATLPDMLSYDLVLLGSYTVGEGRTPLAMVNFLKKVDVKHPNIAVFGTGETQWTHYCGAVDRLALFHDSKYPVLKIEQSPRGTQEKLVENWTTEVIRQNGISSLK